LKEILESKFEASSLLLSIANASRELGPFSSAVVALQAIHEIGGDDLLLRTVKELQRDLPILASLTKSMTGFESLGERPANVLDQLRDDIDGAKFSIFIGLESSLMDLVFDCYTDKRFFCVPHDSAVDSVRIASNLPPNAELCDISSFVRHAGAESLIVVFVYGTGYEPSTYTYFLSARATGSDVRERFGKVVAVDLLGTEFVFPPTDLVTVPTAHFTKLILPSVQK